VQRGSFAGGTVACKEQATLEMTPGTYRSAPQPTGYAADYTKTAAERLDLGDDPDSSTT